MSDTDRALARYVRRSVYAYSARYRSELDRSGLGSSGLRGRAELARLPPTELRHANDGGGLVLRPDFESIRRYGARSLAARTGVAWALGRIGRFNRVVLEPAFKPIHWLRTGRLTVGYSVADLRRLGGFGEKWLRRAGVGRADVVVSFLPGGPTVAHWSLVQGLRRAGIPAVHAGPAGLAELADLAPTVLVGAAETLVAAAGAHGDAGGDGRPLSNLRTVETVLCVGEPNPPSGQDLETLASLLPQATVVAAWVPPGGRAVWSECRQSAAGRADGIVFHTWPGDEVLEVVPDPDDRWSSTGAIGTGELLSTGLGWRGSALLRARTGAVVTLDAGPCPQCLSPGPLVRPMHAQQAEDWRVGVVLTGDPDVGVWQLERRTVDGRPELIVALSAADGANEVALVRRLHQRLDATQFLVLSRAEIEERNSFHSRPGD